MPEIKPKEAPDPRALLGYDGTDFPVLKTDSDGRLHVRGEDQAFSFKSTLLNVRNAPISGADGFCNSNVVPADQIWVVTSVSAIDMTTPTTEVIMMIRRGEASYYFHAENAYKHASQAWTVQCQKHLTVDDVVQVYFIGGLAADDCWVTLTGHIMTAEG